ncbi:MAG: bifunctional methylenetetrahydrofolate dehydrogenase/methenyltetrahydrofolate cyclohydrolase FolD [Bdellovibrionaceae bacterium]|jgi:methylenetetrahydrofolate dehydrogenase (NADP+) / methenyltetrahydrofolate cyclohydrolase|nr:bifunctional methylenetetrahydrofolate dehydrogenase/methenyltetrahydrofolate cyclohydrolase FolD [Pseudobdellovibrionaceae bacterium]
MQVLSGAEVSTSIREKIQSEVSSFEIKPCLAVILVGEDPASHVYVRNKQRACEQVGFSSKKIELPIDASQDQVESAIRQLNTDTDVHAILLQLPLPKQLNEFSAINTIDPNKDADCLTTYNSGLFYMGKSPVQPCTPWGVMEILKYYEFNLEGASALVIGRSHIVGKPVSLMLQKANATVTMAHSRTINLKELCQKADFIVVAAGKPEFLNASDFSENAVVIDVGIHQKGIAESGKAKLCGDVDFNSAKDKVKAITPVPGGVGPMTITMLLKNTLACFKSLNS